MVVVVTVELLGQLVHIGADDRRREVLACGGNDRRIFGQRFHEGDLFGQVIRLRSTGEVDAGFGGLAQHRADTRMGILDERAGVAVEVDYPFGALNLMIGNFCDKQHVKKFPK